MINVKRLGGYRPEPQELQEKHWKFSAVRSTVMEQLGVSASLASDLRAFSSPRHDQRTTSSCVAQSVIKALEIKRIMRFGMSRHVDLSVSALYYLARELMLPSETDRDDGTYISLAADCLRRFGICAESEWPFDESRLFTAPSWRAMRRAFQNKISAWYRIDTTGADRVRDVILALAAGSPVPYGTTVGPNWRGYTAGAVLGKTDDIEGRHATTLVGWDPQLHGGVFIGENSWGTSWGDNGFYLISPEVIAAYESNDFIAITGSWEGWGKPS
jgi:C1A family cysteine protease